MFSVLNSEISLGNLMVCATKYFVSVLRNGLIQIARFTNRKKGKKLFEKVSILLQKAPNLGRFKKDLEKKKFL